MLQEITELSELQAIELDIAKKIHTFCEENDIEYCFASGSLLGAVRFQGFIPWDDDIDIFMPRPDYERFLGTFPEFGQRNELYIASNRTERYFARTFLKVCSCNTVLYEPELKDKLPIGVFVDIWPIDGIPDNWFALALQWARAKIQYSALLASLYRSECAGGLSFIKRAAITLCSHLDSQKIVAGLEKISKRWPYDTGKYVTCFAARFLRIPRAYFSRLILWEFEDTKFYIPEDFDKILRIQYGDYTVLPPENRRNRPHQFNAFRVVYQGGDADMALCALNDKNPGGAAQEQKFAQIEAKA